MTQLENHDPDKTFATTEGGARIDATVTEVETALRALALTGNRAKEASELLIESGVPVKPERLKKWRDKQFKHLFWKIRKELSPQIAEDLAGRAFETAIQADEAKRVYLQKAVEKVDRVNPTHLAKNYAALAQGAAQDIERAQVLRHEPNEIIENRDVASMLKELESLGVGKVIDVEAEEIE